MVGKGISFWEGLFSGAMLVSGRVYFIRTISRGIRLELLYRRVWEIGLKNCGRHRPRKHGTPEN